MTGISYARAVANGKDDGGGSNSQPAAEQRQPRSPRKEKIAAHFQEALDSGKSGSVNREDLPVSYPPENFPPIIISAWLEDDLQTHFSELRAKYFPTTRNYLQGHITLFHALPSEYLEVIMKTVNSVCSDSQEFEVFCDPYTLTSNSLVMIPLKAPKLVSVRKNLLGALKKEFTMSRQDINPNFKPHATVVNKVTVEEAKRIFEEVKSLPKDANVSHGRAKGLDVWFYRGGPWEHLHRIPFGKS